MNTTDRINRKYSNQNYLSFHSPRLVCRLQITDIKVGSGPEAQLGKGVVVQWVLRRMNGYYVSASSEGDGEPFIYRVSTLVRISTRGPPLFVALCLRSC